MMYNGKGTDRNVVIDTNCVVQILGKHSLYHAIWKAFISKQFTWCISNEILSEYEEILTDKASSKVSELFTQLLMQSSNVRRVEPYFRFHLIHQDEDDNKFVDCAIIAGADYIVSEDSHFRILKDIPFPRVNVISLNDFYNELFNTYL